MSKSNFSGIFPLFVEFNKSFYDLFIYAPPYVGKIFLGAFYGFILGFLFAFWRNEIIYNTLLLSSSLWLLSFLNCIIIQWEQIFLLLGITEKKISFSVLNLFFHEYYFECIIAFVVAIVFYKTFDKYK
jgi:hypothetical protein